MGYYSEVGICLKAKDAKKIFENALNEFKQDVKDSQYVLSLLIEGYAGKYFPCNKPKEDFINRANQILHTIDETIKDDITDYVYFHWYSIKWYHEFADVGWIMKHIQQFEYYECVEIGEDGYETTTKSQSGYDTENIYVRHKLEFNN